MFECSEAKTPNGDDKHTLEVALSDIRAWHAVAERLRAALKAVMPIAEAFAGRIDKEPALRLGREALKE